MLIKFCFCSAPYYLPSFFAVFQGPTSAVYGYLGAALSSLPALVFFYDSAG